MCDVKKRLMIHNLQLRPAEENKQKDQVRKGQKKQWELKGVCIYFLTSLIRILNLPMFCKKLKKNLRNKFVVFP